MNRIICPKGHFYDADRYPQCPHCMDGTAAVQQDYFTFTQNGFSEGMQDGGKSGVQEYPADRRDDQVTLILPAEYLPDLRTVQESFRQGEPDMNLQPGESTVFDLEEVLPPVGYLVCIKGRDYGRGFPLKTGVNTVKGQAHVLYEPHRREFYMKPADNGGLCYCNGEVLLEPKKLQGYDRITVGDTDFLLVTVCGEKFCWEELV